MFLQTMNGVQEQNSAAPRLVDCVVCGITNQLAYQDYVYNAVDRGSPGSTASVLRSGNP